MNLAVVTHVYPANPNAPAEIPGNFLPPFIHQLAALGAKIRVLAPAGASEDIFDPAAPVTRFQWRSDTRPLGQFRATNPSDALRLMDLIRRGVSALRETIAREKIDAVLACWAAPAGFIASFAGKPYAVWGLGTDIHTLARSRFTRPVVQRALKRAASRYANSLTLARAVQEISGLDCALLPNMRPLPDDAPPADFSHDRFNFLVAARLEHVKGMDVLLDALAQIAPPRPRVYIAGQGTLEKDLRDQVTRLNLQDDVVFLGFLADQPLASALRACDALVIPSREESLPMIFKEGVRFGVPVVATAVGDLGTLVRGFSVGIVVPPNHPAALAQAMIAMRRGPRELYQGRLTELAAQFDIKRSAEKLLTDLDRILRK